MTAMKGVRKSSKRQPSGIKIGNYVLPAQIVVSGLLALLYVFFLIGGSYEGSDIIVQLIYFALFGVMIFVLRQGQRYYTQLAYAFLVLAIPPMLWYVVRYLGYGPAVPDLGWFLWVGGVSLALGAGLTVALLFAENGKPSDISVRKGKFKEGLRLGGTALAASLALVAAYVVFRVGFGSSQLIPVIGGLAVFAVACAIGEELLFRGLLLSRLMPVVEEKAAFAVQAVAFGAYESTFMYMLNPDPLYAVALFVVAAAAGVLLASMTVKTKSLLSAMLAHTGLYLIIALPVFTQFL